MCKIPNIPQGISDDERRAIYFETLSKLDLSDKTEKRENLTYLSWANAWSEFKSCYPSATYRIIKQPNGLPYFSDPDTGIMVFTEVTVDNVSHEMWLPVMDSRNKAMKLVPYNYQVWDKFKNQHVEKTVPAATMFDINKTIMRCLVKNLSMFGLGLYIYAGDDLPEKGPEDSQTPAPNFRPKRQDKYSGIKSAIDSATDIPSLVSLYLDHQGEIEANPDIKNMLTQKKLQLQNIA